MPHKPDKSACTQHNNIISTTTNNNNGCGDREKKKQTKCHKNVNMTLENASRMRSPAFKNGEQQRTELVPEEVDIEDENLVHAYENLKYELDLSKRLLLHRYFRSTEGASSEYENLCRGCGYGVFEARGYLCHFCECIVHGVQTTPHVVSNDSVDGDVASGTHIYENVCGKCARIYDGDNCICEQQNVPEIEEKSLPNVNVAASEVSAVGSKKKLTKSKSFGKRDKLSGGISILQGLLGSLRRVRSAKQASTATSTDNGSTTTADSSPATHKRLQIVHNVDGYEHVFRTQETFDLQRICELKRTQFSAAASSSNTNSIDSGSDRHIYGRLKNSAPQLSQSHDLLLETVTSTDSLNSTRTVSEQSSRRNAKGVVSAGGTTGKRARISKPRLLRSRSHNCETATVALPATGRVEKQSLYLPDSVCHWMTSLRREVHSYRGAADVAVNGDDEGYHDDDHSAPCQPKSIPAKRMQTLIYGTSGSGLASYNVNTSAPAGTVSNYCQNMNDERDKTELNYESECIEQLSVDKGMTEQRVGEAHNETVQLDSNLAIAQMIENFKHNLWARQMQYQQQERQRRIAENVCPSKRQAIYVYNNNNETNDNERNSSKINNNSRGDNNSVASIHTGNSESNSAHTNASARSSVTSSSSSVSSASSLSLSSSSMLGAAAAISVRRPGLASRRAAYDAISTSGKRCGIHERDSEFVNDILFAFDSFLQRATTSDAEADCNEKSSINQQHSEKQISKTTTDLFKERTTATTIIATVDVNRDSVQCALNLVGEDNVGDSATQVFDLVQLIGNLWLSLSLNTLIVYYEQPLRAFLECSNKRGFKYAHWSQARLFDKYQRFHAYCQRTQQQRQQQIQTIIKDQSVKLALMRISASVSESSSTGAVVVAGVERPMNESVSKNEKTNAFETPRSNVKIVVQCLRTNESDETSATAAITKTTSNECETNLRSVASDKSLKGLPVPADSKINSIEEQSSGINNSPKCIGKTLINPKSVQRPQECTAFEANNTTESIETQTSVVMTVPTAYSQSDHNNGNINGMNQGKTAAIDVREQEKAEAVEREENIYQPIWKFKTVGEVPERYHTDSDYYDPAIAISALPAGLNACSDSSPLPTILISNDVEDHNEWETDDEFMYATQLEGHNDASADTYSMHSSTVRSTHSGSSVTGSTITGFGSSTATLASAVSASLTHHLFRNIGIFYSLSDPKMRAIVYDYDRVYATVYFAKQQQSTMAESSLAAAQPTVLQTEVHVPNAQISGSEWRSHDSGIGKSPKERSPMPPPRTTSAKTTHVNGESGCKVTRPAPAPPKPPLLPDSVQAWKFMLLDVNYIEDEEDMIVSEAEIIRAQESKEDIDTQQTHQLSILQRFKSASIGNLIDLPNEDDKKSITERMRNKLQRGVFKLNVRSPKSEKKSRGIFRRAEATSLYLEDGVKPKYPIFSAPLEQLELNQTTHPNVPRFVVDCVEYIERKDCINQDGLYRASGNKVAIDELKQKLCETYFYDPKLLHTNDIHTLTSLLKQFFRELGAPLVPQETYERLGANLNDPATLDGMRMAFEEMREPNRSTLKFLIKHLTNVAACSSDNRMPASNLAIVWGPCILSVNQIEFDIGRMNTFAKVLIENYARIFNENERLVS